MEEELRGLLKDETLQQLETSLNERCMRDIRDNSEYFEVLRDISMTYAADANVKLFEDALIAERDSFYTDDYEKKLETAQFVLSLAGARFEETGLAGVEMVEPPQNDRPRIRDALYSFYEIVNSRKVAQENLSTKPMQLFYERHPELLDQHIEARQEAMEVTPTCQLAAQLRGDTKGAVR